MTTLKRNLLFSLLCITISFGKTSMARAEEYLIENRVSGKILEVHPADVELEGARVRQMDRWDRPNQEWLVYPVSAESEFCVIENRASGMVLAAENGAIGSPIRQVRYQGETHQQWKLVVAPNDYVHIENRRNGKRLEINPAAHEQNGASLRQMDCRDETVQQWRLIALDSVPAAVGY